MRQVRAAGCSWCCVAALATRRTQRACHAIHRRLPCTSPAACLTLLHTSGWPHPLCCSATGQLDLLGKLRPLLAAATDPELSLSTYSTAGGFTGSGQVVAAGWHAAAVAVRLCSVGGPAAQQLQDAIVSRGILPLLAPFVAAEVPAPGMGGAAGGAAAAFGGGPGDGGRAAELLMTIK